MKIYFARQLSHLCISMEHIRITHFRSTLPKSRLSKKNKKQLIECLNDIAEGSKFLGLSSTEIGAKRFLEDLDKIISKKNILPKIMELNQRFWDDLIPISFLFIQKDKMEFFEGKRISEIVKSNFPKANGEMLEAGICFALERYTSCVFHLMRALEVALYVLAKSLEIPDPTKDSERSWHIILQKIKDEIDRKKRDKPNGWEDNHSFYEGAYVSLNSAKNPWRNSTMHVENNYDEQQALDIFNATDALLRHLSLKLRE